jgi:glutaredoxin
MNRVTLYTKAGCHLCDDAHAVLERVRGDVPFVLEEVVLEDGGPEDAKYAELVPVIEVNGVRAFVYRVDEQRLRALLRGGEQAGR